MIELAPQIQIAPDPLATDVRVHELAPDQRLRVRDEELTLQVSEGVLYVVPDARSRGAGRALLAALEDAARELGYERVRLDTGPLQPEAAGLYGSAGYHAIDAYTDMPPHSLFFEKELRV